MKRFQSGLLALFAMLVSACASVPTAKLEAPTLSVMHVTPQNLSLTEQVLRFSLAAYNPNAVELPIEQLDFVTRFAGIEVGAGSLAEPVTLASKERTPITVDVKADMSKVIKNFADLFNNGGLNFNYEVEGTMTPAGSLGFAGALPFSSKGNLLEKAAGN